MGNPSGHSIATGFQKTSDGAPYQAQLDDQLNLKTTVESAAGTPLSTGDGITDDGTLRVRLADDNIPIVTVTGGLIDATLTGTRQTIQGGVTANGIGPDIAVAKFSAGVFEVNNIGGTGGGTRVNFIGLDVDDNPFALTCRNLVTGEFATSTTLAGVSFWEVNLAGLLTVTTSVTNYTDGAIITHLVAKPAASTESSFTPRYSAELDYVGGSNLIYFGQASPGTGTGTAGWQLRKLTYDGSNNLTSMLFADGSNAFSKVWTNRASYTYS